MFDHIVLVIIFLNCITIAMERPKIEPHSAVSLSLMFSMFFVEAACVVQSLLPCMGAQAFLFEVQSRQCPCRGGCGVGTG